jgi:hypothetical protein
MAPQPAFGALYPSQIIALNERGTRLPKRQPAGTGRRSPFAFGAHRAGCAPNPHISEAQFIAFLRLPAFLGVRMHPRRSGLRTLLPLCPITKPGFKTASRPLDKLYSVWIAMQGSTPKNASAATDGHKIANFCL